MYKIFYYELQRILFSWIFLAMLIVNGMYAWYVLTGDIIEGTACTAPFSVWSCCAYTAKLMPVTVITILLLLCGYYGRKQKQAEILISAAPVTSAQHLLIRSAVLLVCFLILCAESAAAAVLFYSTFFAYSDYTGFLLPGLLIMFPCFLISVAAGHLLARLHQGFAYALTGILFTAGLLEPGYAWNLFGAGYFEAYPLTLAPGQNGEPAFSMQPQWLMARGLYVLIGAGLFLWNVRHAKRKETKA